MLIRSQDKKIIANLNTAQGLSISGEYNIKVWHDGKVNNILGKYSTEAKAIKALDMICDAYELCERTDYQNIGYVGNGVFQMPLDADVEG